MSLARRVSSTPAGSSPLSSWQTFFQVTEGFSFSKIDLGVFFLRWSLQASQLLIFAASLKETTPGATGAAPKTEDEASTPPANRRTVLDSFMAAVYQIAAVR